MHDINDAFSFPLFVVLGFSWFSFPFGLVWFWFWFLVFGGFFGGCGVTHAQRKDALATHTRHFPSCDPSALSLARFLERSSGCLRFDLLTCVSRAQFFFFFFFLLLSPCLSRSLLSVALASFVSPPLGFRVLPATTHWLLPRTHRCAADNTPTQPAPPSLPRPLSGRLLLSQSGEFDGFGDDVVIDEIAEAE